MWNQWLSSKITEAESTFKSVTQLISKSLTEEEDVEEYEEEGEEEEGENKVTVDEDKDSEEDELCIDSELLEFVENLCLHPKTFLDFPSDELSKEQEHELNDWEVRHVTSMLSKVDSLRTLRLKLCPSHLSDLSFWRIYFLLIHNRIKATKKKSK